MYRRNLTLNRKHLDKLLMIVLYLSISISLNAQSKTKHYIGKHYGNHPSWEYYTEVKTQRNGDTLFYKQVRYNRNQIKSIEAPVFDQSIKMLVQDDNVRILYDSVRYFSSYRYVVKDLVDSVHVSLNNGPASNNIKLKKGKLPLFSTTESVELYLGNIALHPNFVKDIQYIGADNTYRNFRIKVVDDINVNVKNRGLLNCYDIAIISLDSSNVQDAKLYINKENGDMIKKEYIVNENSSATTGSLKSIGNERLVAANYSIDLTSIPNPTGANYEELAFNYINQGVKQKKALQLMDKALKEKMSLSLVQGKIKVLKFIGQNDKVDDFVTTTIDDPRLQMMDVHNLGRQFISENNLDLAKKVFIKNVELHPDEGVPYFGMGRLYLALKQPENAKNQFEKSLKRAKNPNFINQIEKMLAQFNTDLKEVVGDLNGPSGTVVHNNILYVAQWNAGKISKLDLTNKASQLEDVIINLKTPGDMVFYKGYIYFSDEKSNRISRIDISKSNPIREDVIFSGIMAPSSLALYNDNLYFREQNAMKISKINLKETQPKAIEVVSGLKSLYGGITIIDNDLYIAETQLNKIVKLDLLDSSRTLKDEYTQGLSGPIALKNKGNDLFITNAYNGSLLKINMKTKEIKKMGSGLSFPLALFLNNNELYITQHTPVPGGKISIIKLEKTS